MSVSVAKTRLWLSILVVPGVLGGVPGGVAWGQQYVPPPPPLTTAPCVPTKKQPCTVTAAPPATTTEKFPFPGDTPGAPVTPATAPAEKFPFPGESAAPDPAQGAKPAPAGGDSADSSSSSSSSSSSDADSMPPDGEDDRSKKTSTGGSSRFVRKHLPKVEDKDTREAQDLEISRYYASTGDFNAAYLRAKDAVASVADDPEAHFLLAGAAAKMKKKDEAVAEYKVYLTMDPDGDHVKAALLGLKELGSK